MADSKRSPADVSASRSVTPIFIHGFLDEGAFWGDVVKSLKSVSPESAVVVDLPGMGKRSGDVQPHGLSQLAEFVCEEIAHLNGPVVLIGHSMGAQIAELAAIFSTVKVVGLVLISPVPLEGLALSAETFDAMRNLGGDAHAQREMRAQFSVGLSPEKLEATVISGLKVDPAVVVSLLTAWSGGTPVGKTPTLFAGPVLLIGGADDGFSTPELLKNVIAPRFPHADMVLQERAGHWPHMEAPHDLAARIDDFLASARA